MCVCKLVPTKIKIRSQREDGLHERASRLGASLPVEMTYITVPMAKSADDLEIVLEQWPILAPYDFVSKLPIDSGVFFWRLLVNIVCIQIFEYRQSQANLRIEVSALLSEGFLGALVADLNKLPEYWAGMLSDFPEHPAPSHDSGLKRSVGCTLY